MSITETLSKVFLLNILITNIILMFASIILIRYCKILAIIYIVISLICNLYIIYKLHRNKYNIKFNVIECCVALLLNIVVLLTYYGVCGSYRALPIIVAINCSFIITYMFSTHGFCMFHTDNTSTFIDIVAVSDSDEGSSLPTTEPVAVRRFTSV